MPDERKGDRSRTKNRVVRVSDELWAAAQAAAKKNNETVSEVIRRSLAEYARTSKPGVLGRSDRDEAH